jgi:hypothetical protein
MITQPVWKQIAQLGDARPLDFGGYFVYEDTTGVYGAVAELLEPHPNNPGRFMIWRFGLDRCTYENGVLSDNPFHRDYPAWFARSEVEKRVRPQDTTYLSNLAEFCGTSTGELIAGFCSADPIARAQAYRMVGAYHGYENLDQYTLILSREQAKKRYNL